MVAESAILKGLMPPSEHNSSLCAITYDVMFRSCLYRNRSSNLLVIVDTPSAVLFCRPNTCGPDIGLPGRRGRGDVLAPSRQPSTPDQSLYHLELATTCQRHRQG